MRVSCVVALLVISGCAEVKFSLKKELPLADTSAVQPGIAAKHYSKIIVLHPSGTDSSKFELLVASFEREFLRRGITVISGAVTGRVVLGLDQGEGATNAAVRLTDIERALVMARGTGAEAILQIGRFDHVDNVESRFLVYSDKSGIREAFRNEYVAWPGAKAALTSGASAFAGRLIDVASGEVVASFQLVCASLWSLPADLEGAATVTSGYRPTLEITGANYPLQGLSVSNWVGGASPRATDQQDRQPVPEWERQGRNRCDQRMIERLIALTLSTQQPRADDGTLPMLEL